MGPLKKIGLKWKANSTPYSVEYGDIYYSTENAIAETEHVFLKGIGAPDCWAGRSDFTIGETGFGTGLNFLMVWKLWQKTRQAGDKLSYISIEGAPLTAEDIRRAHSPYASLNGLSEQMLAAYPVRHPGYHQVDLDGGAVSLLLLFGPVEEMLEGLSADVDAWFLDGFTPSRNPKMWSEKVFRAVARHTKIGGRVATYSSARQVYEKLTQVGFKCQKITGFAGKRESLKARKVINTPHKNNTPWFQRSRPFSPQVKVAVVGAGIAGACMASALRLSGVEVTVIDRHMGPAGEASGNPAGLIQPRPGGGNPAYERLQTSAYFHAVRMYDTLASKHPVWRGHRGVLSFARDPSFLQRHGQWLEDGGLPKTHGISVSASDVTDIAGIDLQAAAAWFPQAGTIDPVTICQALLAETPALYGQAVCKLVRAEGRWLLLDVNEGILFEADAIVLANGFSASQLCPEYEIPLYAKRGQISFMEATEQSEKLRVGLSYGGYATPLYGDGANRCHTLGATYQQWPDFESSAWHGVSLDDHQENLTHMDVRLPGLRKIMAGSILGGRATLRTTTTDHLPVVGAVYNPDAFRRDYHDLRHGKPAHHYPDATHTPGLYILSGLGSRGFALAPLLAKVLVAEMLGLPIPVDAHVYNLIQPSRFLVRQLKRG